MALVEQPNLLQQLETGAAQVCLQYLERYYVLIVFTAYLYDPAFNPDSAKQPGFGQWMKQRPELRRCVLLGGSCWGTDL